MIIDYSIYDQNLLEKAKKLATFEADAAKIRLSYKQINIFELFAKARKYFGDWKGREEEPWEFLNLDAGKHISVDFSFIDEFRIDESWLEPIEVDADSLYETLQLCEARNAQKEKQSIRRYLLYQNYIDGYVLFSRHHDLKPVRKIRKIYRRSSYIQYEAAHYYMYDQCDSENDINNMTTYLVNGQNTGLCLISTHKMVI